MILLRHFTEDDAETIRKKQWPDLSIEEIEAIIYDWKTLEYKGKYFEMMAIVADDAVVGNISLMEHSRSIVSLGVEVYLDERSKGYATAAMKQAFMLATERGYKIIQDQVRVDNKPSIALHERCGFETDGYVFINKKGKEVCIYTSAL